MLPKQLYQQDVKSLTWAQRFIIYALVLLLIGAFLSFTKRINEEAQRVSLIASAKSMQLRLNEYHEYWLLNKQPKFVQLDGNGISYDLNGWVIPTTNTDNTCQELLKLASPEKKFKGYTFELRRGELLDGSYECRYQLVRNSTLIINKSVGFLVKVSFNE
ncbi:hypothetical protein OQJ65_04880 [Vibrio sp. Sgm 22]|uniref:hypothetical protein n=1 Tax=unclassified Vibrio TaxID=2614977 RepID=UPI00224938F8|nr:MULTISPECIES: hypothetical protein [unclassified Vibrio]MCX2757409.1 hypothetical protein [Vibrio sp. 14G-20]MCX2774641.1 hypothetical protein [Vibrio sp. Sgm 22]